MRGGEQVAMKLTRELFVDAHLVRKSTGIRLVCHEPVSAGTAFVFDRPWEGPFSNFATVVHDSGKVRLYYRGIPVPTHYQGDESLCVAESTDGVQFTRLNINTYRQSGTSNNNVIIPDSKCGTHSMGIMLDSRSGVPQSERWKGIGVEQSESGSDNQLVALTSPDGIRWNRVTAGATIKNDTGHFAFDSQNVPLWSEAEGKYLVFGRTWQRGFRWISRWESIDFKSWSASKSMEFYDGDGKPVSDTH